MIQTNSLLPVLYRQIKLCQNEERSHVCIVLGFEPRNGDRIIEIIKEISPKPMRIKSTSQRNGIITVQFDNRSMIKVCNSINAFYHAMHNFWQNTIIIDDCFAKNEALFKKYLLPNGLLFSINTLYRQIHNLALYDPQISIMINDIPRELRL